MSHTIRKAKTIIVQNESVKKAKSLIGRKESSESTYKSKLTICIEILCGLVSSGPMDLTQLAHKLEMSKEWVILHLMLLKNQGLVKKESVDGYKSVYAVTERGIKVLKVVNPIIKEAHKIQMRDYKAIKNTLSGAGY